MSGRGLRELFAIQLIFVEDTALETDLPEQFHYIAKYIKKSKVFVLGRKNVTP